VKEPDGPSFPIDRIRPTNVESADGFFVIRVLPKDFPQFGDSLFPAPQPAEAKREVSPEA
jgi:hypothetical protein